MGDRDFIQAPAELANQFADDAVLQAWLKGHVPAEVLREIQPGLEALGARAVGEMLDMAADAEAHPPVLVSYDAWGQRVDRIQVARGWKELHRVAAEEGIVATAYERRHGPWSRLHQFVRIYLYNPSSAICTCPMAMTDGAARVLELHADADLKQRWLPHLLSRDPQHFWTSGQWMTERSGGSDVSGTATVALLENGAYRLHGDKWFTSATTSELALTLARDEALDADGKLSMFGLELRDPQGRLNNIRVNRLKDKLGTRALPTAELTLTGTPAVRIGTPGHGVRNIATVLNITRAYNAVCAVSYMRRGLALAQDYAGKRQAFGKLLREQPLHMETLSDLHAEFTGALHLVLQLGVLLGRDETGAAGGDDRALLRLLTPVAKLFTAKQAIACVSEVLECFGGQGYMEDTGLPALLRDCQVLSIWEGTTNVLSLDVLRVIEKPEALEALAADMQRQLAVLQRPDLAVLRVSIQRALKEILAWPRSAAASGADALETGARRFAFSIARTYTAVLLATAAQNRQISSEVLQRWCRTPLCQL
ncbi:MAG: acyl-CoA dehydrogenase family protein [Gammaproteobacteria bacterium]|nr:acyl-CoA dehydrogenase family protein [Gammaproteobacteria bacterium]MDE2346318.1 acyl-CoA dehydrogenase family protein [Gammaproteobacteria bacterium]